MKLAVARQLFVKHHIVFRENVIHRDRLTWSAHTAVSNTLSRTGKILHRELITASTENHTKGTSKVTIKQSRNRPGVAQRVPGGLGPQIFMTFGK